MSLFNQPICYVRASSQIRLEQRLPALLNNIEHAVGKVLVLCCLHESSASEQFAVPSSMRGQIGKSL